MIQTDPFSAFWAAAAGQVWGLPMVALLMGTGLYFLFRCRMLPFLAMGHTLAILRGRYNDPGDPGEISHFQALTAALSATIGMGNIAGVAIAISAGGPGALFWMWLAALVGMATKFFDCTLACMYRKADERGIAQGGPMYAIEVGLGPRYRPLAWLFALCGMVGLLPIFQANQLAGLLQVHWGIDRAATGFTCMAIVALVLLGGVVRVGQVTSKVVPAMCLLYVGACLAVVGANIHQVPSLIASIFSSAFGAEAAVGGAVGLGFRQVLVTGVQRAVFSNEAGIGTAALAHGAARTDEPVREGLVAMIGPFVDTHIICTLTALVVLSAGGAALDGDGVVMTANAFNEALPGLGSVLLGLAFTLFALSTMLAYAYYNLKCARYLLGLRRGDRFRYVYLALIPLGALWSQDTVVNMIDTVFALMAIPNLIAALLLAPRVMAALNDYRRRMAL